MAALNDPRAGEAHPTGTTMDGDVTESSCCVRARSLPCVEWIGGVRVADARIGTRGIHPPPFTPSPNRPVR